MKTGSCDGDGLWNGGIDARFLGALLNHAGLDADKVATTYLSNHDHSHVAWQAGARANRGALDWFKVQPFVIALLTAPGCPMIPNGQEFAEDYWIMEDDFGTGRRVKPRPLRWGFRDDGIGRSLLRAFARLIAVRKAYPALLSDDIHPNRWEGWQTRFSAGSRAPHGVTGEMGPSLQACTQRRLTASPSLLSDAVPPF